MGRDGDAPFFLTTNSYPVCSDSSTRGMRPSTVRQGAPSPSRTVYQTAFLSAQQALHVL